MCTVNNPDALCQEANQVLAHFLGLARWEAVREVADGVDDEQHLLGGSVFRVQGRQVAQQCDDQVLFEGGQLAQGDQDALHVVDRHPGDDLRVLAEGGAEALDVELVLVFEGSSRPEHRGELS